MLVAVTGATGYVGRFIINKLIQNDVQIRAWYRSNKLPGPIEWIKGDLSDTDSIVKLSKGADAIIHCALDHIPNKYRYGETDNFEKWLNHNVMGSLQLMRIARESAVKKFIFLSSRATYGDHIQNLNITETHACYPNTHYGAGKLAVESFIQSYGLGENWAATSIRTTGVYGILNPIQHSKWYALINQFLNQEPITDPFKQGTFVHGDDIANAVWLLLNTTSNIAGQIYNCSDIYLTRNDILSIVAQLKNMNFEYNLDIGISQPCIMNSDKLSSLGMCYGGTELLRETLRRLVNKIS